MEFSKFDSTLQETDADLPALFNKQNILLETVGGENFPAFAGSISQLYPDHPNPEELIHNCLTPLLETNDVQSLRVLCSGGLPSLLEEVRKHLPPTA